MRITYILGLFPVISETFIGEEIRSMRKLGHDITIIALHKNKKNFQEIDKNLMEETYFFEEIKKDKANLLIKKYFLKLVKILPFALRQTSEPKKSFIIHSCDVADFIKKNKSEHIHAHFAWGAATYAIGASKLTNIPITLTCHGSDVSSKKIDLKLKCKNIDAVICVSPSMHTKIKKFYNANAHQINCGVDINKFKPVSNYLNNNGKYLFVGRLVDCKGIFDIIDAWSLLPDNFNKPRLDIVGDGELMEQLKQFTSKHNLDKYIGFLGFRSSDWLAYNGPQYKAFISAFKLGNDGSMDTSPLVLKEAMAMGLPIISNDFEDIPKILNEDFSILCEPDNSLALKEAVIKFENFRNEELFKMSKKSRRRAVKEFSLEKQAKELSMLFESLSRLKRAK